MKHITIDAEEEDKEEQKRGTADARLVNMNQVTKHKVWRKLFKKAKWEAEYNSECHICKRGNKYGIELCCADCQYFLHVILVLRYDKNFICTAVAT